jgi:DNA-binding transcriptional LysR family regulator
MEPVETRDCGGAHRHDPSPRVEICARKELSRGGPVLSKTCNPRQR